MDPQSLRLRATAHHSSTATLQVGFKLDRSSADLCLAGLEACTTFDYNFEIHP